MKIGFYNPYFDGFGGGERYTLTLASHWSRNHDVSLFWDDASILSKSQERFGIDLSRVSIVPNIFSHGNFVSKGLVSASYDLIFFLSDGSVPLSLAKKNILHFQVPFSVVKTTSMHLSRIQAIVCNSNFTKTYLDETLAKKASVIYPPIDSLSVSLTKKQKMILSIGRFTSVHTAKKQQELIDAFIQLEKKAKGWRLVLAGGLLDSDNAYFESIVKRAHGHEIELLPNVSHQKLVQLYQQASLYWHAAGIGESDPKYMEHFGISTVEAMSVGAVPVVYKAGGQPEIVTENINGMLYTTLDECVDKTLKIIMTPALLSELSENAKKISHQYSTSVFTKSFDELLKKI